MTAVTGATTATSWANAIADEYLDPLIADYMCDAIAVTPAARFVDLRGKNATVASINRRVSDLASIAALTEAVDSITAVQSTMVTKVQLTAAKYGIKRQPSVELLALQGDAETRDFLARDAGTLLGLYLEDSIIANFASATRSVSHSGAENSILYHLEAMGTLRSYNATPPYFACYDWVAYEDLKVSLLSAGGALLGNPSVNLQSLVGTTIPGQPRDLLGVNTVDSTLCDDTSTDVNSAMFVDARVSNQHAGLGYALLMEPRVMAADDPNTLTVQMTFYQSTGTGIPNVNGLCKIVTIAS